MMKRLPLETRKRGSRLLAAALAMTQLYVYGASAQRAPARVDLAARPGEFIVQLRPTVDADALAQDSRVQGLRLGEGRLLSRRLNIWLVPYTPVPNRASEELATIRRHPDVRKAQFNHNVVLRAVPNDPLFGDQWALNNTGQSGGTPDADIDAVEAWDIAVGGLSAAGDEIVVAVIDGGADLTHSDLNFWKNVNEIPGNGIDDDGNGYVDDFDGWDAYSHDGSIPSSSHGTHVTGIAAAIGNNALGVSGVNWGAKVVPIAGSSATEATVVEAYGYALELRARYNETNGDEGAYIVATNSSFGVDFGNPANFPIWCGFYDDMGAVGILSAAATANLNIDVDVEGDVPTACPSDYLIAVTNTTRYDQRNAGAAFGATHIDLGAPGTEILSTLPGDSYGNMTGTSMATPQVAGSIALMHAAARPSLVQQYKADPGGVALQFKSVLLDSVDPIGSLQGITVSGGRLNVGNAAEALGAPVSAGVIHIVQSAVSCSSAVDIALLDSDLQGNGTQAVVVTSSAGDSETLLLVENPSDSGEFQGSLVTEAGTVVVGDGGLQVVDGGTITAIYDDADDGTGAPATVTDQADVDCVKPLITNVQVANVTASSAAVTFETSEAATSQVHFGLDCSALVEERSQPALSTSHSFSLTGLSPLTSYFVAVTATDAAGNAATDMNGGFCHVFHTTSSVLFEDFESGVGGFTVSGDLWHRTTSCASVSAGHSQPASFYFGLDSSCTFETGTTVAGTLASPSAAVPASGLVTLEFNYLLGTEGLPDSYDQAYVFVSVDGGPPSLVASNNPTLGVQTLPEGGWSSASLDLTSLASDASVAISFGFDSVDELYNGFSGFYIDDVQIFSDATDADGDGTVDMLDNCPALSNPGQEDRNGDGLGDACTPSCDLNADGVVDAADGQLILQIVSGKLPVDGLLARADVAPATGGPTDGKVDVADAEVILRAAAGNIISVCNPLP